LETVRWLVETHDCPLTVKRDKNGTPLSLQTSRNRTLIDLAMTGKPKFDILSYLARRGLSVLDTKDPSLPPKTLQLLMESGLRLENGPEVDFLSGHLSHADSTDQSVASIEDAVSIAKTRQGVSMLDSKWRHFLTSMLPDFIFLILLVCNLLREGNGLRLDPLWTPVLLQWLWRAT
jgi:hypothetical protein